MTDKPLPDRVRPLEGAGMRILFSNMGVEASSHRFGVYVFIATVVIALCGVGVFWS